MTTLREAAQAVLDRWDSPRWEWHQGPTAALMADLRAALAEPVQEPVAWMCPEDPERETAFNWKAGHCENCGKQRIPLYTTPPQRKPLTEGEISNIWDGHVVPVFGKNGINPIVFARAIERAHGIGEQP